MSCKCDNCTCGDNYNEELVEEIADKAKYCVCVYEDTEVGTQCIVNGFVSMDDQNMFVENMVSRNNDRFFFVKTLGNVRHIYNQSVDELGEDMVDVMLCEGPVLPLECTSVFN